jgi:hypothetical protein
LRNIGAFAERKILGIAFLLLALAGAEFIIRGPIRALRSGDEYDDFISPYVQTKVWLSGQNPYDLDTLARSWPIQRASLERSLAARGIPSPYPITGFPLLAPIAAISWKNANLLWQVVEIAAFILFLASLASIVKRRANQSEESEYFIVLSALIFAPFHTGIAVENVAMVAIAFTTAALACKDRNRVAAGLLLACGIALKPTVAIPAFLLLLIRKQWWSALTTVGAYVVLLLIAAVRMMLAGTGWISDYIHNGQHLFDPGTIYDFSSANGLHFDLVNSQVIFSQFLSRPLSQYVAAGIAVVSVLLWLYLRSEISGDSYLLDLSLLSVVVLVPLYHRFYDAALLIFPVAWAITNLRGTAAGWAKLILAATLPFTIPGAALLRHLADSNAFIRALAQSWWWNLFIAPHQAWLVLFVLMAILFARRKLGQPQAECESLGSAAVAA